MKTSAFLTSLLLFIFVDCASQKSSQLPLKQQEQIKKEITVVWDSIMARFQRMDTEGGLQYYAPNFVGYGSDGKRFDLTLYKKYCVSIFKLADSYKWTTYHIDFISITKDIVVISADGKNETIMKTGSPLVFDPSHYTFAFKKLDGQWKLFYHHFSGNPVKQKADQK
jgi:hypothetical protein